MKPLCLLVAVVVVGAVVVDVAEGVVAEGWDDAGVAVGDGEVVEDGCDVDGGCSSVSRWRARS